MLIATNTSAHSSMMFAEYENLMRTGSHCQTNYTCKICGGMIGNTNTVQSRIVLWMISILLLFLCVCIAWLQFTVRKDYLIRALPVLLD